MSAYKFGVIWDLDGVLVDTGELHFRSWVKALTKHHIPFTYEQFRATFGMNNAGILQLLLGPAFTPELLAEIGDDKERIFRDEIRGRAQALPGARECLERLKAIGARAAFWLRRWQIWRDYLHFGIIQVSRVSLSGTCSKCWGTIS